ncbi:hypothetical protein Tco_1107930 [Tanacetum coccineum]
MPEKLLVFLLLLVGLGALLDNVNFLARSTSFPDGDFCVQEQSSLTHEMAFPPRLELIWYLSTAYASFSNWVRHVEERTSKSKSIARGQKGHAAGRQRRSFSVSPYLSLRICHHVLSYSLHRVHQSRLLAVLRMVLFPPNINGTLDGLWQGVVGSSMTTGFINMDYWRLDSLYFVRIAPCPLYLVSTSSTAVDTLGLVVEPGVVGFDPGCSHSHGFGSGSNDSDCWLGCCVAWEENRVVTQLCQPLLWERELGIGDVCFRDESSNISFNSVKSGDTQE